MIIADFKIYYDIDLINDLDNLDFKTFLVYLHNLPSESRFIEVLKIRNLTSDQLKNKELKKAYDIYKLDNEEHDNTINIKSLFGFHKSKKGNN